MSASGASRRDPPVCTRRRGRQDLMGHIRGVFVVRRGCDEVFRTLAGYFAESEVRVVWDRRSGERRMTHRAVPVDRRQHERRRPLPESWQTLGYIFVSLSPPPSEVPTS